jgi:hypothetical protein
MVHDLSTQKGRNAYAKAMSNTTKKETIKLVVDVQIEYETKEQRTEAIRRAKQIVTSTSILSTHSILPKKVKLL